MKKRQLFVQWFFVVFIGLSGLNVWAQKKSNFKQEFYHLRGNNAIDMAVGSSVPNGDYANPEFEIYFHVGYKRYIIPYLNVNFSYNKFNLAYQDVLNEGFMSFDVNVESTIFPNKRFSPYIYVGGGLNAANYFDQIDAKMQGGLGLEYIVTDKIGLKLFSDYNYVYSDELDGRIYGDSDDVYWRMALGMNFYFGSSKRKVKTKANVPTVINSNPIIND
ncbi:Curli production assembly/transport component CsgG [Xanthomarina sp. F2636L]|uniref:Curli production assembly/transport component CsgG n=1 Tax=Xanthomarina sp. F2636L TaxID=2996018 RepID=UPI00225DD72C|nr:Curli production assembly/transport component CsgG [Xanthomarina sp. F2636L]MCX7551950.1 Curli production assembly/transport component CsgG [Xanthomarina sp. F2636L]